MALRLSDLTNYSDIVIQCHDNPDADALACGFALKWYLEKQGKKPEFIYGGKYPVQKSNLVLMMKNLGISVRFVKSLDHKPELLVTVDCQYGESNVTKFEADNIAVIDHHQVSGILPELSEVRSNYGSCATVMNELMKKEGIDINEDIDIATAMYYGLMTDTNGFAEVSHPADKDLRDFTRMRNSDIILFKNSNLSCEELKICGEALKDVQYDYEDFYGLVEAKPCDPNILGIISDMLLEVDFVKTCIVYSVMPFGIKISVRSCVKEVKAAELAAFIAKDMGGGGGHLIKAGGFLKKDLLEKNGVVYEEAVLRKYINTRMKAYFANSKIIYAGEHEENLEEYRHYIKREVSVGYVQATHLAKTGMQIMIRTLEGDVEVNDVAYCITNKEISIIELSTGERKSVVKNPVEESFSSKHKVSYDGRFYCVSHYSFYAEHALVSVYDTRTGKLVTATLKAPDIKELCFTSKGNIAVLTGESDFSAGIKQRNLELVNPETGAIIWTSEFEADVRNIMSYSSLMKSHSYTSETDTKDDIVIAIDSDVYTFEERSGKMYQKTTLPAVASALNLSSESSGGRIAYRNGNIDTIDFATGRIYSDYMIETDIEIREVLYVDGQIVLRAGYSPQLYVMSGHEASDLALIAASDITQVAGGVSPNADYFITRNANDYSVFYFYDDKGNSLYQFDECDKMPIETGFIGNDFIFAGYDEMWIIDPVKGKSDSILSRTGENLCKIDVKNKKETFYAEDALREISDCYMNQFMAISDDDQYVAMCCMDGMVRIVDTSSEVVASEIPLQTIRRDFLGFTKDVQCIIVQGDDYKIRIWNIAKGEYINSFEIDVETEVKYIVDDGDRIAVCTGFYTYMLEAKNYGLVASVPYSMTYLNKEDAFICCSNSNIYKIYYKDYKQLIAEAGRQFPDSELSEEDKVRYNIK